MLCLTPALLSLLPQQVRSDSGAREVPRKDWSVGNAEGDEGAAARHDSSGQNGITNGHGNDRTNTAVGAPGDVPPSRGTDGGGKEPRADVHNGEGLASQELGHGPAAGVEGGGEGGDDDDDDLPPCESCPLCLHLLHAPVRTPCRHTFCFRCFTRWADVSLARGGLQLQRGSVYGGGGGVVARAPADEDAARHPVPCPLCRTQVPGRLPVDENRVSGDGGPNC